MNSKIGGFLAGLSFAASLVMWKVGSSDGHLTELKDFFWVPLPLGVICLLVAIKGGKKQ